ncbi:MAG: zf-HC2 domain-containing protein [Acidobacteria bacterium]|nr:zf-HC2 domain-containing protein [Acidobacteriota bacterium]
MTHPIDILSALLDDELSPEEHSTVTSHLEGCAACSADLAGLARVRSWVRALPEQEPPVPLVPALRRPPRWIWAAASAAAAVLAIGLVVSPARPEVFDLDTLAGQHTARVVVAPGISSIRGPVGGP